MDCIKNEYSKKYTEKRMEEYKEKLLILLEEEGGSGGENRDRLVKGVVVMMEERKREELLSEMVEKREELFFKEKNLGTLLLLLSSLSHLLLLLPKDKQKRAKLYSCITFQICFPLSSPSSSFLLSSFSSSSSSLQNQLFQLIGEVMSVCCKKEKEERDNEGENKVKSEGENKIKSEGENKVKSEGENGLVEEVLEKCKEELHKLFLSDSPYWGGKEKRGGGVGRELEDLVCPSPLFYCLESLSFLFQESLVEKLALTLLKVVKEGKEKRNLKKNSPFSLLPSLHSIVRILPLLFSLPPSPSSSSSATSSTFKKKKEREGKKGVERVDWESLRSKFKYESYLGEVWETIVQVSQVESLFLSQKQTLLSSYPPLPQFTHDSLPLPHQRLGLELQWKRAISFTLLSHFVDYFLLFSPSLFPPSPLSPPSPSPPSSSHNTCVDFLRDERLWKLLGSGLLDEQLESSVKRSLFVLHHIVEFFNKFQVDFSFPPFFHWSASSSAVLLLNWQLYFKLVKNGSEYDGHFILPYLTDIENLYYSPPHLLPNKNKKAETIDKYWVRWLSLFTSSLLLYSPLLFIHFSLLIHFSLFTSLYPLLFIHFSLFTSLYFFFPLFSLLSTLFFTFSRLTFSLKDFSIGGYFSTQTL